MSSYSNGLVFRRASDAVVPAHGPLVVPIQLGGVAELGQNFGYVLSLLFICQLVLLALLLT